MIPILSGNVASALPTGYDVANSCRFNAGDSADMIRTPDSESVTKFTFSTWFKRCASGGFEVLWNERADSSNYTQMYFEESAGDPTDSLAFQSYKSGSYHYNYKTNRLFRDFSAWYHVMLVLDTTQGVAANRIKLYVNGTQETSFHTSTNNISEDDTLSVNSGTADVLKIGSNGSSGYFNGYISEVVYLSGYAHAPTDLGEFDEDSPTIWKPKNPSGLTFGTAGYYLDFEDSGDLGDDESGNTNDFTERNLAATDQATDTPTNNFCTMNPLIAPTSNASTFSEGNCKIVTSTGGNFGAVSTHGVSSGKWYFEVKFVAEGSSNLGNISLCSSENGRESARTNQHANQFPSEAYPSFTYEYDGNVYKDSGGSGTAFGSYSTGDIIIMALDLDNSKAYFGVNGTWGNSSDPTSGATGTGALSVTAADFWHLQVGDRSEGNTATYEINFGGCPAFTISSGNADGNGYGNFEYAPPSGYYALCTQNLAEFGG